MRTLTTCPWCHATVDAGPCRPAFCPDCGHRADVPRSCCDCARCSAPLPLARRFDPYERIDLATGDIIDLPDGHAPAFPAERDTGPRAG